MIDPATKEPVIVNVSKVQAFLHMAEGETLREFREPAKLRGQPVPVFCCLNCSTLYEDEAGEKPIRDDGRRQYVECPCKAIVVVDARTLKFDYEAPACAGCGAIFEAPDKAKVLVAGIELKEACAHKDLTKLFAAEMGATTAPALNNGQTSVQSPRATSVQGAQSEATSVLVVPSRTGVVFDDA